MHRLQLRVRAIAGIAQAIIRQRQNFACRENPGGEFGPDIVTTPAIFINIIAHVQHEINVVARGSVAIGIKFSKAQIGAGEDGNVELGSLADGQGLCAANGGDAAIGRDEAEPIKFAGLQAINGDLHRMVAPRPGDHLTASDNLCKVPRVGHFDPHFGWASGCAHIACPEQHGIRARLTRGDIMGKSRQPQKRLCCQLPARQQQAANAKACRGDQSATVNLECHNWNFPLPRAQGVTTLHAPNLRILYEFLMTARCLSRGSFCRCGQACGARRARPDRAPSGPCRGQRIGFPPFAACPVVGCSGHRARRSAS